MKTKICLLGIFSFVTLVVAEPRVWNLKTGETVTGEYFSSGTTKLVIKTGGTNYFLNICDLSTNDQIYALKMQLTQRQARLDAETNQMAKTGMIEFTTKRIENFPEEVDQKPGWMDAKFEKLVSIWVDSKEDKLGFQIEDKNGDSFSMCFVKKRLFGIIHPTDPWADATVPNPLVAISLGLVLVGKRLDIHDPAWLSLCLHLC